MSDTAVFTPPTEQQLRAFEDEVFEVTTSKGWYDEDRDFETGIALIHSEIAEMFEAYRDHGLEDATLATCSVHAFGYAKDDPKYDADHLCKPEGVGAEAADVLIRLLDESRRQGVQVTTGAVSTYRNIDDRVGRLISHLHRQTARWDIEVERGLARGHSGFALRAAHSRGVQATYGYLLHVCERLGIDLVAETERKIAYNRTRPYRHGGKRV